MLNRADFSAKGLWVGLQNLSSESIEKPSCKQWRKWRSWVISKLSLKLFNFMGYSQVVRQRSLKPSSLVRIQLPQFYAVIVQR